MTNTSLQIVLTVCNTIQVVLLAWIAAWQQRAAYEVRSLARATQANDIQSPV